jgi:hypothetical protein
MWQDFYKNLWFCSHFSVFDYKNIIIHWKMCQKWTQLSILWTAKKSWFRFPWCHIGLSRDMSLCFLRLATESLYFICLITHVYIEWSSGWLLFEIIIESWPLPLSYQQLQPCSTATNGWPVWCGGPCFHYYLRLMVYKIENQKWWRDKTVNIFCASGIWIPLL